MCAAGAAMLSGTFKDGSRLRCGAPAGMLGRSERNGRGAKSSTADRGAYRKTRRLLPATAVRAASKAEASASMNAVPASSGGSGVASRELLARSARDTETLRPMARFVRACFFTCAAGATRGAGLIGSHSPIL